MGSPRFTTREVGAFEITEAWFPPAAFLEPHVHGRAIFGVMLEGSFEHRFPAHSYACTPGTVLTEPAEEKHANRMERAGAHLLVVQLDPSRADLHRSLRPLLDRVHNLRHPDVAHMAWRLTGELRASDSAAPLALEGGVLEMLATAARMRAIERDGARPPSWLGRAREIVEDRFREGLRIDQIAAEVGVHPAHLARAFRQRYREPIGAYARRRRLEWAAARMVAVEDSLSAIAHGAGFADQSHFTRAFRAWSGETPAAYRRARLSRNAEIGHFQQPAKGPGPVPSSGAGPA
jgi:AraC family transcriptional regulator